METNISEPETIAGVPPIIVSGMKMSVSLPEMIISLSPIIISLTETIVSLTDLTVDATAMTISQSSMGVDEREIIVNETELIAFVWNCVFRFMPVYRTQRGPFKRDRISRFVNELRRECCLKSVPFLGNVPLMRQITSSRTLVSLRC